jgi:hypothetical protein
MKNARMIICLMATVLVMVASQGFGWTQFKDGGTHNISSTINDDVWVDYLAPGMQTTVNMLDGGVPAPYGIQGYNDGRINVSGGDISQLGAFASCHINISDGSVGYLWSHDNGQLTISGGSFGRIELYENSQAIMSGGTMNPDSLSLLLSNAKWTIVGSNFAIDGTPVGYGEVSSILGSGWMAEPYRRITGTLANGDMLNAQFKIGYYTASIVLIPEPATLSLLAIGGLLLRRRKA